VTHRATAACAARGGDVVASDQQLAGSTDSAGASGNGGRIGAGAVETVIRPTL
jgi:hypothetical protein